MRTIPSGIGKGEDACFYRNEVLSCDLSCHLGDCLGKLPFKF